MSKAHRRLVCSLFPEPEARANLSRGLDLEILDGDARGIGDAVHMLVGGDDTRGIHKRRFAEGRDHSRPRGVDLLMLVEDDGIGKGE